MKTINGLSAIMSFGDLGAEQVKSMTTRWQEYTARFMGQHLDRLACYGVPHSVRSSKRYGTATTPKGTRARELQETGRSEGGYVST